MLLVLLLLKNFKGFRSPESGMGVKDKELEQKMFPVFLSLENYKGLETLYHEPEAGTNTHIFYDLTRP